ncbi:MAG: dTDP-4-dehydrorhamnose 3,5-epimerase [Wenzhouxiangellaceae bacterium]
MIVEPCGLGGVRLIRPAVHGDERGWFLENFRAERYLEAGIEITVAQINTSHSRRGVLRGLHYQWPEPQGKLVWVSEGRVYDVAVDIRSDSPDFGRWFGVELDAREHHQLWIPPGYAHGFMVLSDVATFSYVCTAPYRPEHDANIAWNDPAIGIEWPAEPESLSARDRAAPRLEELAKERLPTCEFC